MALFLCPKEIEAGKAYEQIAADFLMSKGYQILDRNFRTRLGEIDIVAIQEGELVFVEVKGGQTDPPPQLRVTKSKIRKMSRAIYAYLSRNIHPNAFQAVRIDVVVVLEPDQRVQHFIDVTAHG